MFTDAADALRFMNGSARAGDLVTLCGRAGLDRALRAGTIVRVSRGRYSLPEFPDPLLAAIALNGVMSHLSAAQHWGLDVLQRHPRSHVTVARHRYGIDAPAVTIHWADLSTAEVDTRISVTSPIRTIVDCARTLPLAEALAIADSAVRQRLVGAGELLATAEGLRGAGSGRVRRVIRHADGRAGSALESALRAIFIDARIGGFQPQRVITGEAFSARVDLAHPGLRIVVEADSFEHHGRREALARDCRRYNELVALGWRVLRFAWEHVMFDASWVVAMTRSVIEQARRLRKPGQKSSSPRLRAI